MKTKIKVIIVVIISVLMVAGGLFFAINSKKETIKYFNADGYLINNTYDSEKSKINKEYFKANEAYQTQSDDKYSFKNTDGKNVVVSEESFVHYSNGSIMALKDGVAIDLDKIDLTILNYYNIFEGSVLSKKDNTYEINNLNDTIVFNKMLFKISDNKYLLAANDIVISFADGQTVSTQDYIEIEYANEDVIKIYNDKVNYQTISSNLYIISDNIKIDVAYKTVSKNDVDLLAMVNMVINANDNIEVVPLKDSSEEQNSTGNGGSGGSGGSGGGGGNGSYGNDGIDIDPGIFDNPGNNGSNGDSSSNEVIDVPNIVNPGNSSSKDDGNSFTQPKFFVSKLDVGPSWVTFTVEYEDPSGVLYGDKSVEIVENSTGEVFELDAWVERNGESVTSYTATYINLNSASAYTINVRGQYSVENEEFDRVFISKIFRTDNLGIEIYTDYVASNDLKFVVEKTENSKVTGFRYSIKEKGGNDVCSGSVGSAIDSSAVEQSRIDFDGNKVVLPQMCGDEVEFLSNTNYTLVLDGFEFNFNEYSESTLEETYTVKTLKQSNFLTGVNIDWKIDYSTDSLVLRPQNIDLDKNGGIIGYTYKILPAVIDGSFGEGDNSEFAIVREVDNSEKVVFDLDELRLKNSEIFIVQLEIKFDDNEKTIVQRSEFPDQINIGDTKYPVVVEFVENRPETIDYETIAGTIIISDEGEYLKSPYLEYKVVLKEKNKVDVSGSVSQGVITSQVNQYAEDGKTIILPVVFRDIIPCTSLGQEKEYDMFVYIKPFEALNEIYIGYTTIETKKPEAVNFKLSSLSIEDLTDEEVFALNVNIEKPESYAFLDKLELELYECINDQKCESTGYKYSLRKRPEQNYNENTIYLENLVQATKLSSSEFISTSQGAFTHDKRSVDKIYQIKFFGRGENSNGEYPIEINLNTDGSLNLISSNSVKPLMNVAKPSLSVEFEEVNESNVLNGYKFKFKTMPNLEGEIIQNVNFSVVELVGIRETPSDEGDKCEKRELDKYQSYYDCVCKKISSNIDEENIELSKIPSNNDYVISSDLTVNLNLMKYVENLEINESSGKIDVGAYESSNTINRGKNYCVIYSGDIYSSDGSKKEDNVINAAALRPEKQPANIVSGYLKEYALNESRPKVTFSLSVVDEDKTGTINIYQNGQTVDPEIDVDEYIFDVSNLNLDEQMTLNITQNLKDGYVRQNSKYSFKLGGIGNTPEFSNNDLNQENTGVVVVSFDVSNISQDKIYAIKIGGKYHKISKTAGTDSVSITSTIPIIDLPVDNSGNITFDWQEVYLVYDLNKINVSQTNDVFLTKIDDPNLYFSKKSNTFKNLVFDEDRSVVFKSDEVSLAGVESVGYTYNGDFIHQHLIEEQPISSTSSIENITGSAIKSTSKILTTYGVNESYISFTLKNGNCDKVVISGADGKTCGAGNKVVAKIPKDIQAYSIKYDNGGEALESTYNEDSYKLNDNIAIKFLGEDLDVNTYIGALDYEYIKNEWDIIDKEIIFEKYLNPTFNFKKNIYLKSNEYIEIVPGYYDGEVFYEFVSNKIQIGPTENVEAFLSRDTDSSVRYSFKGEGYPKGININDLAAGEYDIALKISFYNLGEETFTKYKKASDKLEINKNDPTPAISNNSASLNFDVSMGDSDGVLTSCFDIDEYSSDESLIRKFFNDNFKIGDKIDVSKGLLKSFPYTNMPDNFYNNLSEDSKTKMYYLLLMKGNSILDFSAIPFSSETVNVDWTTKISSIGDYSLKVLYCTEGEQGSVKANIESKDFYITNVSGLEIVNMYGPYTVGFTIKNLDDLNFTNNFDYIQYTQTFSNETSITKTVHKSAVSFVTNRVTNSTIDVTLLIGVPLGTNGSDVVSMQVNLYKTNPAEDPYAEKFKSITYVSD